MIDATHDRAGAAPVSRSISAFAQDVTDDRGGLGVTGVVLFDRVDERLLELVGERCGGGRRVLGVALSDAAVSVDATWRLLGAGLSDVVTWDGCADGVRLRLERWAHVDQLAGSTLVAEHLIGSSPVWRDVVARCRRGRLLQRPERAAVRGERDGQGAGGAADPLFGPTGRQGGAGAGRLHDDRPVAVGQRAVRARAGCVHRSGRRARRGGRGRRWRDAVPRRGRRAAAGPPGGAPAGRAGGHLQASGKQSLAADALPARVRDESRPAGRVRGGALPRRPVLPPGGGDDPIALAARASAGHPVPGRALPPGARRRRAGALGPRARSCCRRARIRATSAISSS